MIYDDATGTRVNEPQGINFEAVHRQLGAQAAAALDEARRTRWTVTRDHTLIFAVEAVSDVTVNQARHTLTFQNGA
ncbi:hypothetical protein [Micrococcus luteus]|uniref:hypothetical protein n=1 Tax=Micrococcus luteus TaxID=1270 RepID=UPI003D34775F